MRCLPDIDRVSRSSIPVIRRAQKRWFMVRVSRIEASEPPRYVVAHDDVTALKQAQEALRQQATTDELTGVANRRSFMEAAGHRVRAAAAAPDAAVQRAGDRPGSLQGCQRHLGSRRWRCRAPACCTEWSAGTRDREMFSVARGARSSRCCFRTPRSMTPRHWLNAFVFRFLEDPVQFAGDAIRVTLSIGIAVLTASDGNAEAALVRADRALYEAKHAGTQRGSALARPRLASLPPPVGFLQRSEEGAWTASPAGAAGDFMCGTDAARRPAHSVDGPIVQRSPAWHQDPTSVSTGSCPANC